MQFRDKLLIFFCTLFSVQLILANLVYQKFVYISLPFCEIKSLSAGVLFYPITFLIVNLLTELFGQSEAKLCIKIGLIMNIIVSIMINLIDRLESCYWSPVNSSSFSLIFGKYNVSFIGSMLATYISQLIDIYLYSWIKILTKDRFLWLRAISTSFALFIDSSIVIIIITIFNKTIPISNVLNLIFDSFSFKLIWVIVNTILLYLLSACYKKYLDRLLHK